MGTSFVLLGLLASPLSAPIGEETCPWCKNDPALMQAAGVLSHGPIPIGPPTPDGTPGSEAIAKLPATQWLFLETAHLRWASSLGPVNVDQRDKERVMAELARLRDVLPTVPETARKLDPWLRLHLLAMRGEELYARFQALLGVSDADFSAARTAEGPYMGDGPFLGEREKFDIVLHATRRTHQAFTESFTGSSSTDALRCHLSPPHKMLASIPAEDADLKQDRLLFAHVAHNLSHQFLSAYKHFFYYPPVWLDEGLAHAIEKEIEPEFTTREGEEGGLSDVRWPSDWWEMARGLASSGKAATLAQLLHAKEFDNLDVDGHVVAWSRVRFLMDEHPKELAAFLGGVKGQLDERGYQSGDDLPALQRRLLKEIFGWTPADFDAAWAAWARRAR